MTELRFNGSLWCNLDIALRNVDQIFKKRIRPSGITVIEWYILRALLERDGQHASELASAVGRAATSFTPNLDKLQKKGFIERRPDEVDRRAVRIYLTDKAHRCRNAVLESANELDKEMLDFLSSRENQMFERTLLKLQNMDAE
jgi:DNA-binding MarR family transcriptional regulator